MPSKTTALIIGAGPVGLTMAADLTRYGVPVRIIDKNAERTDKSKALVVWSRTLELLERMGLADAFIAAGSKVTSANIVAGSKRIAHISLEEMATPYPFALMLPQSETERLLEQHLNTVGIKVERQTELIAFRPGSDGISVDMRHLDGQLETLDVDWLIGCDGAHSTVRHGLSLGFEGQTRPSDWILADVHQDGHDLKTNELSLFWHSSGTLAIFPISPGRYRVIADVGDASAEKHRADPTVQEVQAILDERGPGGITVSNPIWLSAFRINERKVKDYRIGRIFLAGDAAHVHSPAGGQGMNTGMQDACNLAWKLAMVCRGVAKESLLDSFSIERSEVGRQVLRDAGRLTTLAVMKGGVTQAIRNHTASLLFGLAPVRHTMANKLAELSIGYPHSPLTAKHHHGIHPAPGERAPKTVAGGPVGAGDAPRFTLFATSDEASQALVARYPALIDSQIRSPFEASGVWLVRPDGYVSVAAGQDDLREIDDFMQSLKK